MTITFAKRNILQVEKVSKARKVLFGVGMIGILGGVSSLVSSALVFDKSGGARLLRIGGISLGAGIVLAASSHSKPIRIRSSACESPWVMD